MDHCQNVDLQAPKEAIVMLQNSFYTTKTASLNYSSFGIYLHGPEETGAISESPDLFALPVQLQKLVQVPFVTFLLT